MIVLKHQGFLGFKWRDKSLKFGLKIFMRDEDEKHDDK